MGFSKPPGVPCPPNNPHCHGTDPVSVPIDGIMWQIGTLVLIILFVWFLQVRIKKQIIRTQKLYIRKTKK